MRALVLLGPLGSGKTTTLIRLLADMPSLENVHLVINEVGRFAVDIDRINAATDSELDVASLTAGCLGCANLAEFDEIVERLAHKDGLLLVEPTGVADGHEIKAALTRHSVLWRCLTLVNPVTLTHDLRAGIIQTQLDVATRVAVTRPEAISENLRDGIMRLLAPYGIPVVDMPLDRLTVSVASLLNDDNRSTHAHTDDACSCDHNHSHRDHHHGHGYITTPIMLRNDITVEYLRLVCERLDLRRGKGVVDGRWFDRVGSEFTLGEERHEEPYAIFISNEALDEKVVASLTKLRTIDMRSLKQRLSDLTKSEAHEEIDRLLALAAGPQDAVGGLRLSDESIDLACEIAKAPAASNEYRTKAKQARIRHAINVYDLMDWESTEGLALVEIGAVLAWQSAMRAAEVGADLLHEVCIRKPATMWLMGLDRIANPRYDLVPEGYDGPLSPSAGVTIVNWGTEHEGLFRDAAVSVFGRMADRSYLYPEWRAGWLAAISNLHADV